jgi:hypothetical protein
MISLHHQWAHPDDDRRHSPEASRTFQPVDPIRICGSNALTRWGQNSHALFDRDKADLIDQRTQIIRRIANIAQSRNVGSAAHNGT